MPERIRVGVVTLIRSEEAGLEQSPLRSALLGAGFDFSTPGKPYADSPNEWVPFGDGRSIRALVTDVLGEPGVDFPSTMLDQFATRRSVNLFIIDPLVLLHQQKASLLVDRIQEHICSADKAFCIILPQNLPQPFREQLRRRYEAQLPDLKGQPLSEFEVERFDRLEQFLTRIEDYLRGYPTRAQFEQSKRVFSVMGINPVALQPTIGAG